MRVEQQVQALRPANSLDLTSTRLVEIVGHGKLACHEAEAATGSNFRLAQRDDLHHRFTRLGNDERLALCSLIYQLGKLCFCIMNIDSKHSNPQLN